jgi:hypothetical protein
VGESVVLMRCSSRRRWMRGVVEAAPADLRIVETPGLDDASFAWAPAADCA